VANNFYASILQKVELGSNEIRYLAEICKQSTEGAVGVLTALREDK
jgi:hypothetical protein